MLSYNTFIPTILFALKRLDMSLVFRDSYSFLIRWGLLLSESSVVIKKIFKISVQAENKSRPPSFPLQLDVIEKRKQSVTV